MNLQEVQNKYEAYSRYGSSLKDVLLERCRLDPKFFIDYVFRYTSVEMHHVWQDFMSDSQEGLILAPRGHGKTEQITVGRICWEIGGNPGIRIKLVTESDDLANKILSRISATILKNERFKEVFPDCVPSDIASWTKSQLTTARKEPHKDPTIEGSGVITAAGGGRADIIFFDDITGYRNAIQFPKMRKQVKDAVYNTWLQMLDGDDAKWYMIGTPWHEDDVIWEIRNNEDIPKATVYMVDEHFNSPWPEKCSREFLKKKLRIVKQRAYNRAYRLQPMSSDEVWVNPTVIESCKDTELKVVDVVNNSEFIKYVGVDLGHREGEHAAPSVVFTIARTPTGKRIPCDIRVSHESSPLAIGRVIIDVYKTLKPAKIMVENVGAQKYLVDLLKSMGPTGLPIEGYFTGTQKMSIETGVPSLLAELETGSWIIPFGAGGSHDAACECNYCLWITEIKGFPLGSYDTLMASWFALEGLRKVSERGTYQGNFSIWRW